MKIDFEFQTQYGVFKDALYLEDDHTLTQQEIEDLKQNRLNTWLTAVETPHSFPVDMNSLIEIEGIIYEKIEIEGQIVLKPLEA